MSGRDAHPMGWWANQNARSKAYRDDRQYSGHLGNYTLSMGRLKFPIPDTFKREDLSIASATAVFERGDYAGERTTATRVAAGAVIAGPVGAIVGGMFRKDKSKVYVTITMADGRQVIVEESASKEKDARKFAETVNAAGAHYAAEAGSAVGERGEQEPDQEDDE